MMFRLIKFEIIKLLSKKNLIIFLTLLCCVNMGIFIYSQNLNHSIGISAYQKLENKLDQIPNEERYEFVKAEYEKYNAFMIIEQLAALRVNPQENQYIIETLLNDNPHIEEKYGHLYQQNHDAYYTDYLESDVQFLNQIADEFKVLHDYPQYLQDIQDKAQTLSTISIFQHDENTFEHKNIIKSAHDYQQLQNTELIYTSEKGIIEVISFPVTNFLIMTAMMIFVMTMIIEEKEKKLFSIIKLTDKGQYQIIFAKMITLILSIGFTIVIMVGSQLLYSSLTYGLGDLSRPLQSLKSFTSSPFTFNVFQFLIIYMFMKWLAACVIGLIMMEIAVICKNKMTLCLGIVFFILVEYLLYLLIPSLSFFYLLKYMNVIAVLQTDVLFAIYRNVNVLSEPISMHFIIIIGFIIIFMMLIFINYITYHKRRNMNIQSLDLSFPSFHFSPSLSLIKQEFYKVFVIQRVWILCLLCIGIQYYQYQHISLYIDSDTQIYQSYMKTLEGPLTPEKEERLLLEQKKYDDLNQQLDSITDQESRGLITKNQAIRMKETIQQQLIGEEIFQKIYDQYQDIKVNPHKQFVYEKAYQEFFVDTGWTMMPTLLLFVMIILSLSSCIHYDYQNQMYQITQITMKGNHHLLWIKCFVIFVVSLLFFMIVTIPPLILLHQTYGFFSLNASITSLSDFSNFPVWMSIGMGCLVSFLMRFFSVFCLGMIIQWIAVKTRHYLITLFVSLFLFFIPLLLAYGGFHLLNQISLYPLLFHGQYIHDTSGLLQILFSFMFYGFFMIIAIKSLFKHYQYLH